MTRSVLIWDAPTRLFHWGLVACVIGSVTTAQIGGAMMQWHFRLGYAVLCLLLFRLVWGFAGGYWSRFASFLFSPRQVLDYLRGRSEAHVGVGHNPLGALSVFAMLAFLLLQVGSGLMSDDEISAAGPLTRWVSSAWVGNATYYHRNIGKIVLLALVVLHLSAIGFYFFKKHDNLVKTMLTGNKQLPIAVKVSADSGARRVLALAIFFGMIALVNALLLWLDA